MADQCWQLVTRGIIEDNANPLRLGQVYVNLDTTTPHPRQRDELEKTLERTAPRNLTALEALFETETNEPTRRVVLTGEPGSGKSTFFQFINLCLTYKHSRATNEIAKRHFADLDERVPKILRDSQVLPFRILLGDFADWLGNRRGTADEVTNYLKEQLENHHEAVARLPQALQSKVTFVLFDGLDEVPPPKLAGVRQAITAFATGDSAPCRIGVTCRIESYRQPEFRLPGFPEPHEIAPLTFDQRKTFVEAWYRELELQPQFKKGEGANCATTLIRALEDDRLKLMAGNPFFLTAMAGLHRPGSELPKTDAGLMHKLVGSILEESRKRRAGQTHPAAKPELATLLERIPEGFKQLRWRLETIAYETRMKRQDRDNPFLDEDTLRQKLRLAKTVDDDWVNKLIELLRNRAGLVQSKDSRQFQFAYRFEEFLAGCHLAKEDAWTESFDKRALALFKEQKKYARQVVLWASGFFVHVLERKGPVRDFISALTPRQPVTGDDGFILMALELAADIARDIGLENWEDEDIPYAAETARRLRLRLEEIRDHKTLAAETRARAASAIGRLGDPRPGVGQLRDAQDKPVFVRVKDKDVAVPGLRWCGAGGEVEPGDKTPWTIAFPKLDTFKLGEPKNRKDRAYGSFTHFDCARITQPFFLGKYPVTVAQYQMFVDAGGYERPEFWTEAGNQWRLRQADKTAMYDWLREEYEKESFPISRPRDYEPVYQTSNHPRVGVCWFEAHAYAAWLNSLEIRTEIAGRLGLDAGAIQLRLPAEAEWELAARWPRPEALASDPAHSKAPAPNAPDRRAALRPASGPDERLYPWGDEKTPADLTARCNWSESGIHHTSAAGLFPRGDAGCGASDLAGNVWEWTQTQWIKSDDKAALARYNSGVFDEATGNDARVLRGGSWGGDYPEFLRAARRISFLPGFRLQPVGFRVVCVVVSARKVLSRTGKNGRDTAWAIRLRRQCQAAT